MVESAPSISFPVVFEELVAPEGPTPATMRAAFDAIFAGTWTAAQIAGFAVALRVRGEDAAIIATAVEAMRSVMIAVDHGIAGVVDTAGTGGDGKGTLNVSTAAAIVVAACGLPVAKHGNRSVSSRTGSADVLEALGIPFDLSPADHTYLLKRAGITFLFAPAHHPALRHSGAVRRELAIRTVFNALGPIANPARATHQLIGTYDDGLRAILAGALGRLGSKRAWIVRGEDGLDEISPFAPTRVTELIVDREGTRMIERTIAPEHFGLSTSPEGAIDGGDATENAARIVAILRGGDDPASDAVVINAAAAIAIGRETTGHSALREIAGEARASLRSGKALHTLEMWRSIAAEASSRRRRAGG